MWFALAGLVLIAYAPGAAIYRMPWVDRARRASLPADERFFWAVIISASLSTLSVLALALIGRYSLPRLLIFDGALVGVIGLLARGRLSYAGSAPRPGWRALAAAVVVAAAVWIVMPPAEYVIGGRDPGVYFNEGVRIAQRGQAIIDDPTIAEVPRASRDLFFPTHHSPDYYGLRFMGFFILNPDNGAVSSQFPQLFPASIAIGYGLDGLTGARLVPVFWGALGLLALFVSGARLFGPVPAAAGTLLLALNVAQVWFSRYPASEIMMQPLMFGALLAYTRAHTDEDRFFGPFAGAALGLMLLFRVEAGLAVASISAVALLELVLGRRPRLGFLLAFAASISFAAWYLTTMVTNYMRLPYNSIRNLPPLQAAAIVALGLVAVALVAIASRVSAGPSAVRRAVPWTLMTAVVGGAVYAYFFRVAAGRLAEHDAAALRTFAAYYVTAPALAAAVLGYVITVRRRFWHDPALLLTTTLFALFFFYKILIVPEHFWMARRFLPLVLPMTLMFAAVGALFALLPGEGSAAVAFGRRWRVPAAAIGAVFLIYIGILSFARMRPILHHVEYAGVVGHLEQIARTVGDEDLLLIESRNASDAHVLGPPLAFIYGRHVLLIVSPAPNKKRLADFLWSARGQYRRVLFLGGGDTDILSRDVAMAPLEDFNFSIPEFEQLRNAFPQSVKLKEFRFGIYQFVDPPPAKAGFTLDVGNADDLYVLRMHHAEQSGGRTFRWTTAASLVTLLGVTPETRTLTLWMNNGGRPAQLGPARPLISLGDHDLGSVTLTDQFAPYTFEVPLDLATDIARGDGSVRMRIATSTWSPATVLHNGDERELGVMLDRIEVR